jgi:hypothetical protein
MYSVRNLVHASSYICRFIAAVKASGLRFDLRISDMLHHHERHGHVPPRVWTCVF